MIKSQLIIILIAVLIFLSNCSKDSAAGPSGSGAGGSTARFTIAGNYLYVVDNSSVKAFDISNPSVYPELKSKTYIGINIETIFPYQGKLFIGSSNSMYIYSLADPEHPEKIAQAVYQFRRACDPVVVKDDAAYATLNGSGNCGDTRSALVVYDIRDIAKPSLKTEIVLREPYGLGISDSALYVCDKAYGLIVYDVTSPYFPYMKKVISGDTFYDVIPYGNVLICQVLNGIHLYDISNRYNPVLLAKVSN